MPYFVKIKNIKQLFVCLFNFFLTNIKNGCRLNNFYFKPCLSRKWWCKLFTQDLFLKHVTPHRPQMILNILPIPRAHSVRTKCLCRIYLNKCVKTFIFFLPFFQIIIFRYGDTAKFSLSRERNKNNNHGCISMTESKRKFCRPNSGFFPQFLPIDSTCYLTLFNKTKYFCQLLF